MRRTILIVVITLFSITLYSQENNSSRDSLPKTSTKKAVDLRKLNKKECEEYLIKIAKAAIMLHGPTLYKEFVPRIELRKLDKRHKDKYNHYVKISGGEDKLGRQKWLAEVVKGRNWYIVTYPIDDDREKFERYPSIYNIMVYIWEDTGIAFRIHWGTLGIYTPFIDEQSEEKGNVVVIDKSKRKYIKK